MLQRGGILMGFLKLRQETGVYSLVSAGMALETRVRSLMS